MLEMILTILYQNVSRQTVVSVNIIQNNLLLLFSVFIILLPLFLISGFLAFYLAREIDRDNKKKEKKGIIEARLSSSCMTSRKQLMDSLANYNVHDPELVQVK